MRQHQDEIVVATRGRAFYEMTNEVGRIVAKSGIRMGLATVHICHTSASLIIQENADPDVRIDLEAFFSRFIKDGDGLFIHTAEGEDDMSAHVRSALTSVNVSIPVREGALTLGTWQGIYLWEHRAIPHRRRVIVHVLGE